MTKMGGVLPPQTIPDVMENGATHLCHGKQIYTNRSKDERCSFFQISK